jgi:thymidylate synthase ThyX
METVEPKVYLIGRPSVVWENGEVPALREFMADHDLASVHSDDAAPAEIGGRIDYRSFDPAKRRPGGARAYFGHLLAEGHTDVIELAHWNVLIRCSQGVAREVLRDCTAERSQASTRYIDYAGVPLVSAESEATGALKAAEARFDANWRRVYRTAYRRYVAAGCRQGLVGTALCKWTRSHAARYVPFGTATWLVLAINCQTARYLILQRANPQAHPEFRCIALQLHRIFQREAPNIFQDLECVDDDDGERTVRKVAQAPK